MCIDVIALLISPFPFKQTLVLCISLKSADIASGRWCKHAYLANNITTNKQAMYSYRGIDIRNNPLEVFTVMNGLCWNSILM